MHSGHNIWKKSENIEISMNVPQLELMSLKAGLCVFGYEHIK
jgi:hypothetical protein